ncbi:MAG: hypothetical protein JSV35_03000 [Candidatus Bathyarchaeota archaeon]|nr:MAG: hypothetical protein JSV35_03000 [Candidatus Bathyarchaeota archaeon]
MESSVQKFTDRILEDAREEAKTIVTQAEKSAEVLLENRRQAGQQKAEEDMYALLRRAESEVEIIRGRVATETRREAGWLVLSKKEQLVTKVLDEVKRRLEDLQKSKRYIPILEKTIIDAGTALEGGKLEVMLSEDDSTLPIRLDTLAKAITEETGVKTSLTLAKKRIKGLGGALVKMPSDKIIVDNTFEAILKRREKELRFRISRILFRN